jgi:hypothetical protein
LPPQVVPLQIGNNEAADMPALGFAALRHVVNSRNVSRNGACASLIETGGQSTRQIVGAQVRNLTVAVAP